MGEAEGSVNPEVPPSPLLFVTYQLNIAYFGGFTQNLVVRNGSSPTGGSRAGPAKAKAPRLPGEANGQALRASHGMALAAGATPADLSARTPSGNL